MFFGNFFFLFSGFPPLFIVFWVFSRFPQLFKTAFWFLQLAGFRRYFQVFRFSVTQKCHVAVSGTLLFSVFHRIFVLFPIFSFLVLFWLSAINIMPPPIYMLNSTQIQVHFSALTSIYEILQETLSIN